MNANPRVLGIGIVGGLGPALQNEACFRESIFVRTRRIEQNDDGSMQYGNISLVFLALSDLIDIVHMRLYRDARRVFLHTGIVVSLSVIIIKTLLRQHSCHILTNEQQIENVRDWHESYSEAPLDLRDILQHRTTDRAAGAPAAGSKLWKAVTKSPVCPDVSGREDILYIIKTGATEALDRLHIHIITTLQCWPNSIIFSDFAEEIKNTTVHDALSDIDLGIRLHHPDFDIWRRLNAGGRDNLVLKDFSGSSTNEVSSKLGGALSNPGWKIDKYKNLPMVEKALRQHPDLKWYIFTDADTFISPTNLMTWLSKLDHTKPLYLGNPSIIASQTFAHGGSGYILSAPATKAVVATYAEERGYWDNFAAQNWAGDHVLGTMLQKRLGIPLTWAYPLLQAESPFALDFRKYKYSRKLWCYPAVSYHHVSPGTIEALWGLERGWKSREPMRHRDVYWLLVGPRIKESDGRDWDNLSEDEVEAADGDRCPEACEANSTCVQYSYTNSTCRTSATPRYGRPSGDGMVSGWLVERIWTLMNEYDDCNDGRWILS